MGLPVGIEDPRSVGLEDGPSVGLDVGRSVGLDVGWSVGAEVSSVAVATDTSASVKVLKPSSRLDATSVGSADSNIDNALVVSPESDTDMVPVRAWVTKASVEAGLEPDSLATLPSAPSKMPNPVLFEAVALVLKLGRAVVVALGR